MTNLDGLYNNPTPWRVYAFFSQGGGQIARTPFGLQATFLNEADAIEYVKVRTTNRLRFRIVNESDLPNKKA